MIPSRESDYISGELQVVAAKLLQALNPQEHVNLAEKLEMILLDYQRLVRRYAIPELIIAHLGSEQDRHDQPPVYYG